MRQGASDDRTRPGIANNLLLSLATNEKTPKTKPINDAPSETGRTRNPRTDKNREDTINNIENTPAISETFQRPWIFGSNFILPNVLDEPHG